MFLIDRRNATPDRRQHQIKVWGDRRMPKEERLYREKLEKEWRIDDPTKEKVETDIIPLIYSIYTIIVFICFLFLSI